MVLVGDLLCLQSVLYRTRVCLGWSVGSWECELSVYLSIWLYTTVAQYTNLEIDSSWLVA